MRFLWLLATLFATQAHAYSIQELREDCQAAESFYNEKKSIDPYQSVMSARCIGYIAGFADGYAISDYLAEKVGNTQYVLSKITPSGSAYQPSIIGFLDFAFCENTFPAKQQIKNDNKMGIFIR